MKKLRRALLGIGFLLVLSFGVSTNINAEYVDDETPQVEAVEDEFLEDDYIPQSRLRAILTIPKEGVYDTIKDTKNSAGVMTARSFYLKGKLVEKRTYTQTGSTDCRMKNKYLYYSNDSTVYIHRTYSNTKAICYNLQTKRYNEKSQIQAHSIYEGKLNGKVIESRYYDASGTYYTSKAFYKAGTGVLYKRDYWKGAYPNRVTHTANYNNKGDEWINATYYHYPTDVKKEYITYTGTSGANKRKTVIGYREDGTKTYYIVYNTDGERQNITYYDVTGTKKTKEGEYEDGIISKMSQLNTEGAIVEEIFYSDDGKRVIKRLIYTNSELVKSIEYFEETGEVEEETTYHQGKEELINVVTSYVILENGNRVKSNILYLDNDQENIKEIQYVLDESGKYSIFEYQEGIVINEIKYNSNDEIINEEKVQLEEKDVSFNNENVLAGDTINSYEELSDDEKQSIINEVEDEDNNIVIENEEILFDGETLYEDGLKQRKVTSLGLNKAAKKYFSSIKVGTVYVKKYKKNSTVFRSMPKSNIYSADGWKCTNGNNCKVVSTRGKSWNALKSVAKKSKKWKNVSSLKKQYLCHYDYVGSIKTPWNIEIIRPNKAYWRVVLAGCNP